MGLTVLLHIGLGVLRPDLDPTALFLEVPDVSGHYVIPYIQSSRDLTLRVEWPEEAGRGQPTQVALRLARGGRVVANGTATPMAPVIVFPGLAPGEYELQVVELDGTGRELGRATITQIGIGTVIAAIGDSITEGYYSRGYWREGELSAALFPAESVSGDRRNFPSSRPLPTPTFPK